MDKRVKQADRQLPYVALLQKQMVQLQNVERRMDRLFQQLIDGLDEASLAEAAAHFDELVLAFPDLRLDGLEAHLDAISVLLSHLDLESGPLDGFEAAMARLYASCVTPRALEKLRSKLYTIAATAVDICPELLPTVAVACLSLNSNGRSVNAFVERVICVSAIESFICASLDHREPVSVDVSTWLAANPSAALIAAVGEGPAYYYASIPGVLPFLDADRVLFDVDKLYSCATQGVQGLGALVDGGYHALLCAEIERVQCALRQQYPPVLLIDLEMLTRRARTALDELPPQVNPLLVAIYVQSWVRYLYHVC